MEDLEKKMTELDAVIAQELKRPEFKKAWKETEEEFRMKEKSILLRLSPTGSK